MILKTTTERDRFYWGQAGSGAPRPEGGATMEGEIQPSPQERLLLDTVSNDDWAWFDAHPRVRARIRPTVPGEFLRGDEHLLGVGLTFVLKVDEHCLMKAPHPDGPWMWVAS